MEVERGVEVERGACEWRVWVDIGGLWVGWMGRWERMGGNGWVGTDGWERMGVGRWRGWTVEGDGYVQRSVWL